MVHRMTTRHSLCRPIRVKVYPAASIWFEIWEGRGSGSTKFRFFQATFRESTIFSGNFTKHFDFSQQMFEKFQFFQAIPKKNLIFQAKIGHLQLLLSKLFYFSSKVTTSNMLPVHDKIK